VSPADYPSLVVIGAMRSGTTSFHALLGRHPQIFMSPIKGPGLFLDPGEPIDYPSKYRSTHEKRRRLSDAELLAAMREGWQGERHFGESTDLYSRHPVAGSGVPRNMLRCNPEIRLLYLLRHPVARLLSQFHFERAKPYRPAPRSLGAYLDSAADPICASRYASQLHRYLASGFRRERIHLVVFEELLAAPQRELARVTDFLRIDLWPRGEAMTLPHLNAGPPCEIEAKPAELERLRKELDPEVRALEEVLGRRIASWDLYSGLVSGSTSSP
jgi:hypothetical protein